MSDNDTISEAVLSSKMVRRTEIFRLLAVGYTAPQAAHEYNKAHPDDKDVTADWINQTKFKHKDEFAEVKITEVERLRGDMGTIGHKAVRHLALIMDKLKAPNETDISDGTAALKFVSTLIDLNKKLDSDIGSNPLLDPQDKKAINDTMKNLIKEKDAGKK